MVQQNNNKEFSKRAVEVSDYWVCNVIKEARRMRFDIFEFKVSWLVGAVLGDHDVQRVAKRMVCQSRTKVKVNGLRKVKIK